MTLTEFKNKIEKQIKGLSENERLKFALNICNRLLPEYNTFYKKNKWGNPDFLTKGLKCCEHILNGGKADNDQIEEIKNSIEGVTPDTEDFGDRNGSYALNACVAIIETLQFIQDKNIEHIINVSSQMTDTIDSKITETFGNLSNEEIDTHPWMIDERNNQIELTI